MPSRKRGVDTSFPIRLVPAKGGNMRQRKRKQSSDPLDAQYALERVPLEWNGTRSTFLHWRMSFFGKPASTFPGHALGACPCNGFLLHGEARVRFTAFHEQDLSSVGRRTAVAFATVCS